MTILNKSYPVQKAVSHLASEAILTKSDGGSPLEAIARKFGEHTAATMEKLGATNEQINGMKEQLAHLEQKMARGYGGGEPTREKSVGKRFVENQDFRDFAEKSSSGKGAVSISMKATLTSATTNAAGSAGAGVAPTREREVVTMPRRRLRVRDLLPTIQVNGNSVEYIRQKGRNNNAGMVAEGALKPSSDIQYELVSVPIRTIAHWMKASRQVLEDFDQLEGLIDTELMYGLGEKEETQLLFGDGTGQNISGLQTNSTAFVAPYTVTAETSIDKIAQAICQLALANYEVDGAVINTADWWRMKAIKDAGGNYIIGSPQGTNGDNLWGLPIVPTTAMTIDKFLVGSFQQAATLYDRWQARLEAGYENDDFTRNLVTILGEERIGLAVKRPGALVYGDFGLVA